MRVPPEPIAFACGQLVPHLGISCSESGPTGPVPAHGRRLDAEITLVEGAPPTQERIVEPCKLPAETICPGYGDVLEAGYEVACASVAVDTVRRVDQISLRGFGATLCAPAIAGGAASGIAPEWHGRVRLAEGAPAHRITLRASAQPFFVGCTLQIGTRPSVPFVTLEDPSVTATLVGGEQLDLSLDCVSSPQPGWIQLACFGGCPQSSVDPVRTTYDLSMLLTIETERCEGPC